MQKEKKKNNKVLQRQERGFFRMTALTVGSLKARIFSDSAEDKMKNHFVFYPASLASSARNGSPSISSAR
jgi:hypothetical protein